MSKTFTKRSAERSDLRAAMKQAISGPPPAAASPPKSRSQEQPASVVFNEDVGKAVENYMAQAGEINDRLSAPGLSSPRDYTIKQNHKRIEAVADKLVWEFKAKHGNSTLDTPWSPEVHTEWVDLINKFRDLHAQNGCLIGSPCREVYRP